MSSTACRFYQSPQGCFRGASCTFRHNDQVVPRSTSQAAAPSTTSSIPTPSQARPCHFFASDRGCRNGSQCPFVHSAVHYDPLLKPKSSTSDDLAGPHVQSVAVARDFLGLKTNAKTSTATSSPTKRKLHIQANPQSKETISEILPVLTRHMNGPFFAIDVECVATGKGTNDRDVARIAVVDEDEKVVFDQYVKPTKPIVSYLTPLTGITQSNLKDAPELHEALGRLKTALPVESVIVGQSIKKDLEWLTLHKPTDYKDEFDVADLFRLPMQATNGVVRYRYFSLRHVAKHLLGHDIQEADHDPVVDARYAMKVFKQFRHLHEHPGRRDAVLQTLLKTPRTPSFADRFPIIDGVSMRAPRKRSTSPGRATRTALDTAHGRSRDGQPPDG